MKARLTILLLSIAVVAVAQVYLPHRRAAFKPVATEGESTLANGLIAHWDFEEGSGTVLNDIVGSTDMTIVPGAGYYTNGAAVGSYAYWFDGSATYAYVADPDLVEGLTSLSVSAWVQSDTAAIGSAGAYILVQAGSGADSMALYASSGEDWTYGIQDTSPAWQNGVYATAGVLTDWVHVVGVFDGDANTVTIYTNKVAGATVGTCTTVVNASTRALTIGAYDAPAGYWQGRIDDVRVWNRALTEVEIEELFNMLQQ